MWNGIKVKVGSFLHIAEHWSKANFFQVTMPDIKDLFKWPVSINIGFTLNFISFTHLFLGLDYIFYHLK